MTTLDVRFEEELEIFRTEAEQCAQFLYAFLAVHDAAYRKKRIYKLLNRAPLFWNTCLGALQTSTFIALGRVFDSDSPHNIHQLLRMAQDSRTQLFSREALGRRKQGANSEKPVWLDDYLLGAHEPSIQEFRRLRKEVSKWRRIYEANYRDVRHQYFAHKQAADETAVTELFRKGTTLELQRLVTFLGSVYEALWQLFMNGKKLVLQKPRYSLKEMRRRGKPAQFSNRAVQEGITHEAYEFLETAAGKGQRVLTRRARQEK